MNTRQLFVYLSLLLLPFIGFFKVPSSDLTQANTPAITMPPTITPTIRASPTITPITNNQNPLLTHIQELMSTNYGCKLPCFGNLQMGSATTDDIQNFVRKIDYRNIISNQLEGKSPYGFWLLFNDNGLMTVTLSTENNILQKANIGLTKPNNWLKGDVFDLSNVIANLGTPDRIYMLISGPPLGFTMVLVYDKQGVLIRYEANFIRQNQSVNEPLDFCFSPDKIDLYQIDIWLQNPSYGSLVEDNQPDLHDTLRETRPFWPLERFINTDEAEFTQTLTEDKSSCFQGLSLKELSEQGYQY